MKALSILMLAFMWSCSSPRVSREAASVVITIWPPYGCRPMGRVSYKGHVDLKEKTYAMGGEVAVKKGQGYADVWTCKGAK